MSERKKLSKTDLNAIRPTQQFKVPEDLITLQEWEDNEEFEDRCLDIGKRDTRKIYRMLTALKAVIDQVTRPLWLNSNLVPAPTDDSFSDWISYVLTLPLEAIQQLVDTPYQTLKHPKYDYIGKREGYLLYNFCDNILEKWIDKIRQENCDSDPYKVLLDYQNFL